MRECAACQGLFDDETTTCPHDGAALGPPNALLGRVVEGRYRIDGLLGTGGMGSVYRATQLNLDRTVAIKIINAALADRAALDRFKREALVVARLRHPNIVSVYDFGATPDVGAYIVMEFLPGTPLSKILKSRGPLPVDQAVDLLCQVCGAVAEAHASGVIHRDLKPHNILVEEAREGLRAKVLDFGIAKICCDVAADGASLTRTGAFLGTPAYMAPEQWSEEEPVDTRADIYALGCVLYEVLTGRPPFVNTNTLRLLQMHTGDSPALPSARRKGINPRLDAVVLRALAKDPADRYQTADDFSRTLEIALGAGPEVATGLLVEPYAPPSGHEARRAPFVGRTRELATLAARLDRAMGGECQLALVAGEAGAGKSRLLDEVDALARGRGVRVLHGRFAEGEQALSYDGFFEVIREYLRSTGSGSTLADLMPDLLGLFPMLADVDTNQTPVTISKPLEDERAPRQPDDRAAVFETLATALARMSGGRPLVVCLEELHTANVSVEALQYAVRRLVTVPLLVVATYRSGEVDKRHAIARLLAAFRGDPRFALVELEPLTEAEHRELIESMLGGEAEDALAARLYQVSEGNPYFATELVRSLEESGDLTNGSGAWGLAGGAGLLADALPETVQEAVRQRLDELPEPAREALAVASVLGRDFEYRDLEALAGEGAEATVDDLVERGYLEEDRRSRGDRLVFASGVVREVLYAALPKRKRRALHRRHAEQLEARYAGRLERVLAQLVHHWVHADEAAKVFEHGVALARRSLEAHAADEALRVATAALEFAREDGEAEIEGDLHLLAGGAQRMRGNVAAAVSEYESAVRAFERAGLAERALEAIERAAEAAWEGRRTAHARRWVDAGIAAARAAGAAGPLARLLELGATIANLGGETDLARAYSEEAAALAPAPSADEEAPRGGRLVVAVPSELAAREPARLGFVHEFEVLATAYEPLVTWDARGGLVPLLAERWEQAAGGREFVFTIRRGVTLHDGRALGAAEVKASFDRLAALAAGSPPAALAPLESVEVVSEHELRFRLTEPLAVYPALLADLRAAVVVEPAEGAEFAAGTGPFVPRTLEAERAVFERHEAYWGEPARVDAVEFRVVRDSADRAAGVRAGDLDLAGGLEAEDLEALLARPGRTVVVEAPRKSTCFVLFNGASPAAVAARALTSAVRVHDVVRSALGRFAHPAEGLLPPGILGHDPGRRREPLSREAVREALAASGLELPVTLRASISPTVQARLGTLLAALFREWEAFGVSVSVETRTAAEHAASWEGAEGFDFTLQEWDADYDDPDNFAYALFHSRGGLFRRYYSSEELDRLIDEARAEARPAAREELYRRVEEHLLATGLFLPLFHGVDYRVASAAVRNLAVESAPPFVAYARVAKAAVGDARPRARRAPIHVALPSDFESIDPREVTSVAAIEVSLSVFDTLLRPNAQAQIVPWLAAEYRMEERGRRYRFRLRDGVRFHDGRRLTARDVRYSFERLLRSGGDYDQLLLPVRGAPAVRAGEAAELEGFRILSNLEFVVELDHPLAILPALLTCGPTAIVPEGTATAEGTWQTGCAGTGPFRVARVAGPGRVELEANPQYWRRGYPLGERLHFTAENASAARAAGYREGRYSVAWLLARADEEALLREPEHAGHAVRIPEIATTMLVLNATRGVFADEAMRHRFARALDRDAFVRRIEGQGAVVAHGLIPPGLLGHEPVPPAETAVTLDGPGGPVRITVAMTPPLRTAWGDAMVQWLGARGFRVRIVNETYAEYEAAVAGSSVDVVAVGWNFDYPDADSVVYGAFHSTGRYGGSLVASAEVDRLADLGRTETDAEARRAVYRELETVVAARAHAIPLYHARRWFFARPELEGVALNLFQPYLSYERLYVRD